MTYKEMTKEELEQNEAKVLRVIEVLIRWINPGLHTPDPEVDDDEVDMRVDDEEMLMFLIEDIILEPSYTIRKDDEEHNSKL